MASKVDSLLEAYIQVVNEPWVGTLSGQERVWFLVYDPTEQRKVDLRTGDFENATLKAGKRWASISLKSCFPQWMAGHAYREEYFADPEALTDQLETDFKQFLAEYVKSQMEYLGVDEQTVVAVRDVSALYGFGRLSDLLISSTNNLRGRMLIFFPGEFSKNQYRLLNARDGWSYLARPITT